jgi:hypothetical protein
VEISQGTGDFQGPVEIAPRFPQDRHFHSRYQSHDRDDFWLRDTLPAMGAVGSSAEFGLVFVRSRVQLPGLSARDRWRHDVIVNTGEWLEAQLRV